MLKRHIETLIRDQGGKGPFPLEPALRGLSHVYGKVVRLRNRSYDIGEKQVRTLPCPVISVGNITVGGAGKTPMTLYLARELRQRGFRPMIVSRGYGGTASKHGGVASDGNAVLMDSREAGDEPYMMAVELETVPVVVGQNRFAAAMCGIARFSPDVIVLDDGFQHRKLFRDLDLLLLDASYPLGNGYLLPRGPLREPMEGMGRADMFVLTRSQKTRHAGESFKTFIKSIHSIPSLMEKPVITSNHDPVIRGQIMAGTRDMVSPAHMNTEQSIKAFAFSGIAQNRDFRKSLAGLGFQLNGHLNFPDHHPYTQRDLEMVIRKAEKIPGSSLVTTQKDLSRLKCLLPFPLDLWVVGVDLKILANEVLLWEIIQKKLTSRKSERP